MTPAPEEDEFTRRTLERADTLLEKLQAALRRALREDGIDDEWEPEAAEAARQERREKK